MTLADITEEHYGWVITVPDKDIYSRDIYLRSHRTWTHDNKNMVGLVDASTATGRVIGTERHYTADTRCKLGWQWKKQKRAKKTVNAN